MQQEVLYQHTSLLPRNMYLTSDPDGTMTYQRAVEEVFLYFVNDAENKAPPPIHVCAHQ